MKNVIYDGRNRYMGVHKHSSSVARTYPLKTMTRIRLHLTLASVKSLFVLHCSVSLSCYTSLLRQEQPILLLPRPISKLKQRLAKRTDSYFLLLPFYNQFDQRNRLIAASQTFYSLEKNG